MQLKILPLKVLFLGILAISSGIFCDKRGNSYQASKGIRESIITIMAREAVRAKVPHHKPIIRPRKFFDRSGLPQHPASAHIEATFLQKTSKRSVPLALTRSPTVQRVALNFLGAQYSESGFFPPDADGAVGATQYFLVASGIVKTFNKATGALDGILDTSLDNFFVSVLPSGTYVGDIRVFYDTTAQRFFVLGRSSDTATERMLIAVSSSSTITSQSSFNFFYITTATFASGLELDYPTLGCDSNAIYSGFNLFNAQGQFVNSSALVIQKSSLLSGGPIFYTVFNDLINYNNGTGLISPVGVNNFDASPTQGYFIGIAAFYLGELVLNIINNPGSTTPTISSPIVIPVAPTSEPILVNHEGNIYGSSGLVNPTDDRLNWSHVRNGNLWTCHNAIGVDNTGSASGTITRDGVRWYQLNLSNPLSPSLIQYGTLFNATATNDTNELNYFVGGLMSSGQGHMILGSTVAGTSAYLNATYAGHLNSDPLGTLDTPINYTNTSSAYNFTGDLQIYGYHRWGDYSTISIDPSDNMTLWATQEYCNAANSWGLQVAKILAPPPATIIATNPESIHAGQSSVTLYIIGSSSNGSGFYDPGVGFASRLQVTISGGVSVTSITYINPTTISLIVNTTKAYVGKKIVTVINPDGQSTSASVLTVIS